MWKANENIFKRLTFKRCNSTTVQHKWVAFFLRFSFSIGNHSNWCRKKKIMRCVAPFRWEKWWPHRDRRINSNMVIFDLTAVQCNIKQHIDDRLKLYGQILNYVSSVWWIAFCITHNYYLSCQFAQNLEKCVYFCSLFQNVSFNRMNCPKNWAPKMHIIKNTENSRNLSYTQAINKRIKQNINCFRVKVDSEIGSFRFHAQLPYQQLKQLPIFSLSSRSN